jgi:hypothetical protein
VYSVSAIRLIEVGPVRRRFHDAHIDLRGEPPNVSGLPDDPPRTQRSTGATLVVADNAAGKTLISQLVNLVVSPRGSALARSRQKFAECFPFDRAGYVMLEWEDEILDRD